MKSDSEEHTVGGLDQIDAAVFDAFDYVALGHIHRPQRVRRETLRYAGSPLKYSFSEADYGKSVPVSMCGKRAASTFIPCRCRPCATFAGWRA